ncbi:unnamed protein product [Diamesa serratosioi]
MKRHKSEILKRSIPVLVYSSYVVYVLCMVWSTICKRKIGKIIKKLCEIDEQLLTLKFHFNYKQQRAFVVIILSILMFLGILIVLQGFIAHRAYVGNYYLGIHLMCFFSLQAFAIFMFNYALLIFLVRQRVQSVNAKLILCIKKLKDSKKCTKNPVSNDIRKLARIYGKLTDVIQLINQTYSLQAMLFFAVSFWNINLFFFGLVVFNSLYGTIPKMIDIVISNALWNTFDFAFVMIIIIFGSGTLNDSHKTVDLVFKGINSTKDEYIKTILKLFADQIHHTPMSFTCRLFKFDWTLLYTFISASVMYVVILIQFEPAIPQMTRI